MPHRWLILGSGGHGRSVADAIRAQGDAVLGFLDDRRPADELVAAVPVLGPLRLAWDVKTLPCAEGAPTPDRFVVAIGNPVLRQRVVVHPLACVSPLAQLAPGCVACLSSAAPVSTTTRSAALTASWASPKAGQVAP